MVNESFAVDTDYDLYVELRIPPLAKAWFERYESVFSTRDIKSCEIRMELEKNK